MSSIPAKKINKSLVIRELKQRDEALKPAEITRLIKTEHGVDVSPNYVSSILLKAASKVESNGSTGKRLGRPPKSSASSSQASANGSTKLHRRVEDASNSIDSLPFESLKKAKSFAAEMGGIATAKTALEALSQIVDSALT